MSVGGRSTSSRGNSSRRVNVLPNLSVAGKRETKCEITRTRGRSRGEKRERGGRRGGCIGRGREVTGKLTFVEQQGIFSCGLNDDGRHDKARSSTSNGSSMASVVKLRNIKKEEKDEDSDVKPITYDFEWLSDEEVDSKELGKLFQDGFLSDLKPGKVIPLVLPESEETQFQQLIIKKEENVEMSFETINTSSSSPVTKKKKNNHSLKLDSESEMDARSLLLRNLKLTEVRLDPTITSSRRAAFMIQEFRKDESGAILMLQLPSILSSLKNRECALEKPKSAENTDSIANHCLAGFSNGSQIGKLRIRKGGRVELSLCGMSLDVTCGVSPRHNESVLVIDSEQQSGTSSVIKNECGSEQQPSRGYILGKIVNSFICSHNLPKALDCGEQEQEQIIYNNDVKEGVEEDLEMRDLLSELRSIEQKEQSWAKWTVEYSDFPKYDDS